MAICIGVTGVASILLWFYFKNRIETVESKLDNMFSMIQNFSQPPESATHTKNDVADYYQQESVETTIDPFENKELQYQNQNSSPQLPTEIFEKEIEEAINNNAKLIEVSDDSGEDSSESEEEESEEEEEEVVVKEVVDKKDNEEKEDSLDEVETDDDDDDDDDESVDDKKNVELKEEVKEYSSMKVSELKKLAQTKGLTGYTKLNKAGLVNLLENN